jgi:hypothetical protein
MHDQMVSGDGTRLPSAKWRIFSVANTPSAGQSGALGRRRQTLAGTGGAIHVADPFAAMFGLWS